ncbi:hypothetical protein FS749_004631 [Ceratobasidium sp. UAMH 11750]|nr:hypothetical protein FS749_004631 [Ceratobasidium sp. UAMH 11750]
MEQRGENESSRPRVHNLNQLADSIERRSPDGRHLVGKRLEERTEHARLDRIDDIGLEVLARAVFAEDRDGRTGTLAGGRRLFVVERGDDGRDKADAGDDGGAVGLDLGGERRGGVFAGGLGGAKEGGGIKLDAGGGGLDGCGRGRGSGGGGESSGSHCRRLCGHQRVLGRFQGTRLPCNNLKSKAEPRGVATKTRESL